MLLLLVLVLQLQLVMQMLLLLLPLVLPLLPLGAFKAAGASTVDGTLDATTPIQDCGPRQGETTTPGLERGRRSGDSAAPTARAVGRRPGESTLLRQDRGGARSTPGRERTIQIQLSWPSSPPPSSTPLEEAPRSSGIGPGQDARTTRLMHQQQHHHDGALPRAPARARS